jgi:hypothetical protein
VPGPAVCDAQATISKNGQSGVRVRVKCVSDKPGECEAAVTGAPASALRQVATGAGERIMEIEPKKLRRTHAHGPLKYRRVLKLHLTALGKERLAASDLQGVVAVRIRRLGNDFRPPVALVRLLRFKSR